MKKHEKNGQLTRNHHASQTGYRLLRQYTGICLRIGLMLMLILLARQNSYGQWTQLGIDIYGEASGDQSGFSVSLSSDGSRVAIGANTNDDTADAAGHVRVYEWDGMSWTQLGMDIDGEAEGDESGQSVSLSSDGSRVAIGAPYNDGTGGNAGHVRVYEWDGMEWTQLGTDIDGEATGDISGVSVSLSSNGSRVAIGAPSNNGTASDAGHVRVYEWDGTSWMPLGLDIEGEAADDQSGRSVSLSSDGSRVAIGAIYNDGTASNAGHVRVYEWGGISWTQLGMDIEGEAADDQSGYSVSLSSDGSRVAIGALQNDGTASDAGHVRVYEWNGTSWTQLGMDIDGEAAGDQSGRSVSLSSDGSLVAIGAFLSDGAAGHVRVYEWDGTGMQWTQLGIDIDGESAGDVSGFSVSLSPDSNRVAIGAIFNDGTATNAGQVRVYEFLPDTDGDGLGDGTEAAGGSDPVNPCDPIQMAGYTGYDSTNATWAAADCDSDGVTNGQEVTDGTDPYNVDTDGDGVSDGTEAETSDPLDPCDPVQEAGYISYDSMNSIWGVADCDEDGLSNRTEFDAGSDPYDPTSPSVENVEPLPNMSRLRLILFCLLSGIAGGFFFRSREF